jgi:pilus assembly protein FimV
VYRDKFNRGLVWALLLAPCIAHAAGLGNLTVRSSLGQPLLAEIDLISVRKDEASTLIARLAPPEAYRKADLQYGAVLTGMRFTIEKRPGGEPYIKVMSTRSVNEPFVNLVVELSSSSGRFTREYTALIDPPGYTPPQSMAAAPVAPPPAAEARPMAPRPAPAAVAAPAPAAAAKKEYTVKRGDTLSKIAASVKPEGIALEQMLVGIFRNNPDAFMNHNMNLMKAGATLTIPEKEQLTALPRQEAAKEVRVQTADWKRYRRRLSDRPGKASEHEERKHDVRVKVEDKAASGKPKDVLKLSKGQPGDKKRRTVEDRLQALEEELIARERALNEANQRIKELEKTVKEGPK